MLSPLGQRPSSSPLPGWGASLFSVLLAGGLVHCSSDYKPKPPAGAEFASSSNAAGTTAAAPSDSNTTSNGNSNDGGTAPALPSGGSSQSSASPDPTPTATTKPTTVVNAAGTVTQVAVPPAPSGPTFSLVGVGSSRCIDVTAAGLTTDGTAAVLQDCTLGSPQQGFTQTAAGQLRLIGTNRCLDTAGATTTSSAPLVSAACADIPSQKWDVAAKAGVGGAVTLKDTTYCIDVANAKVDNGSPIHTSTCKVADNQAWRLGGA